jgi:endosialidase-like protein
LKLPAHILFRKDLSLMLWKPHGTLDEVIVKEIEAFIDVAEERASKPFNRFADLSALDMVDLNFKLVLHIALHRRLVSVPHSPGFRVGFKNTTGHHLTGIGAGALQNNTTASFNTAIGVSALHDNDTGENNTAIGADALAQNTMAEENTAIGAFALSSNTHGDFNTASGAFALSSNTIGFANTAQGSSALEHNTSGSFNTATGDSALASNTQGNDNMASGAFALQLNTTGVENTAIGAEALSSNTDGDHNTAIGVRALLGNTASDNTACGYQALLSNAGGSSNTAVGRSALSANITGVQNTAVGVGALSSIQMGNFNTAIGGAAGFDVTSASNVICIGHPGANVDNSCFIGNVRGVQTHNANAINVVIDSNGQLGTMSSSCRFKNDIEPMDKASEAILALTPVRFHYKSDATNTPQFGLVAEDVAKVNPDLVVRDKHGEIYSVRYDAVNAMLLNEFLKEHRKVQEQNSKIQQQEATIAELRSTVAQQQQGLKTVTAHLDEQAAQIQKVSAQLAAASLSSGGLEASKFATGRIRRGGPAPQVVNNP